MWLPTLRCTSFVVFDEIAIVAGVRVESKNLVTCWSDLFAYAAERARGNHPENLLATDSAVATDHEALIGTIKHLRHRQCARRT
jgi:hypothetical protein